MRLKISLLLIMAVALAFVAGLTSFMYLGTVNRELVATRAALTSFGDIVHLPVVTREVRAGEALVAADLGTHPVPVSWLPADALQSLPELAEGGSYMAFDDIRPGGLILQRMLGVQSEGGEMQPVQLGDGLSGGAFSVANLEHLRDWLSPGSRVDLFMLSKAGGDGAVRLIGQGFEVLSLPAAPEPMPTGNAAAVLPGGTMPLLQTALLTTVSAPSAAGIVMLAGPATEIARALAAGTEGGLHLALSSGPRNVEQGQVLVGPDELAGLPLAVRVGNDRTGSAVTTMPVNVAAAPAPAVGLFSSSRESCTTAVVRGGARVHVEVPC